MDITLEQPDGSILELKGCYLIDYDINSLYAGSTTPISFINPVVFTPSIYSRQGSVLIITGPWAVDVDNARALEWANANGVKAFSITSVSDDGAGEAAIHFENEQDAVVAMLALA